MVSQKDLLLAYAKAHRLPNSTFFMDDGYSGTNFNRPGFQAMLSEIEMRHVGTVLTKDLSRLGRNSA
ncbi:MAG: recombinase family protein, partial [Christensenellaceae bacterium]|nr:recombinase family protein [Christensenellaceae bacterium]